MNNMTKYILLAMFGLCITMDAVSGNTPKKYKDKAEAGNSTRKALQLYNETGEKLSYDILYPSIMPGQNDVFVKRTHTAYTLNNGKHMDLLSIKYSSKTPSARFDYIDAPYLAYDAIIQATQLFNFYSNNNQTGFSVKVTPITKEKIRLIKNKTVNFYYTLSIGDDTKQNNYYISIYNDNDDYLYATTNQFNIVKNADGSYAIVERT